jgi:hypothetical protein
VANERWVDEEVLLADKHVGVLCFYENGFFLQRFWRVCSWPNCPGNEGMRNCVGYGKLLFHESVKLYRLYWKMGFDAHSQVAPLDTACVIHNHIFDLRCFLFSITAHEHGLWRFRVWENNCNFTLFKTFLRYAEYFIWRQVIYYSYPWFS